MHIAIFNGPPGSGKDTCADHMVSKWGYHKLEMKGALRNLAHQMASLSFAHHSEATWLCERLEYDRNLKSTEVRPEFGNRTWRDFLIWISETVCKPIFGSDIFSLAAVAAIRNSGSKLIVFSDCGFQVEIDTIHRLLKDEATIDLVHIKRPGFTFAGDSRSYVNHPNPAAEVDEIVNDLGLAELRYRVDLWMECVQ